jgi:Spy/CpxP family protein refolding chaperone
VERIAARTGSGTASAGKAASNPADETGEGLPSASGTAGFGRPLSKPGVHIAPDTASAPPPAAFAGFSRQELEARAQKVEGETNRELRRLVPLLNLTEDQQDRIFSALAQQSPSFLPGMIIQDASGGDSGAFSNAAKTRPSSNSGSQGQNPSSASTAAPVASAPAAKLPEEIIHSVLTPEQQEVYADSVADQQAWWNEVLGKLAGQIESPGANPDPAGELPASNPPPPEILPEKQNPVTGPDELPSE